MPTILLLHPDLSLKRAVGVFASEVAPTLNQKDIGRVISKLHWWRRRHPRLTLRKLGAEHISAGKRDLLSNGRAPGTVNRYLAALSTLYRVAIRDYGAKIDNPVSTVGWLPESEGVERYLSLAEKERLLAACRRSKQPALLTVVMLAIGTGGRRQELLKLRWNDVQLCPDFDGQQLPSVTFKGTKNGTSRTVPLRGPTLAALLEWRQEAKEPSPWLVFPSPNDGGKPVSIRRPWERALAEGDVQDFRFHDTRHTFASYLVMAGVPLRTVMELMGHKNYATVQRYAHLSSQHLAESLDQMHGRFL